MNALAPVTPIRSTVALLADLSGPTSRLQRKLPRELAVDPDRDAVLADCRAMVEASQPAPFPAFALQVERLAAHYPESRLTEGEAYVVKTDWRRLLGHLPADILAEAVDHYLLKPERFMPTIGQFNAVAQPMWAWRERLLRRARETLALIEAERGEETSGLDGDASSKRPTTRGVTAQSQAPQASAPPHFAPTVTTDRVH